MTEPESARKLFLGGLDYATTEDGLRGHFDKYGKLVDVVVMRFPDTKRSRGFGFITFSAAAEADAAFEERPHNIDGATIETKRATPREEMNKDGGHGGSSETHRKLFIGGLNYSTTDETLKEYFSKFGELVDCVVMKFRDTKRSRGFGFVTYSTVEQVDECQSHRPHSIDGTKVETKRATPRDDTGPGSGQTVTKVFIGGLKDGVSDEDLQGYFGQFGDVANVEQMTDKSTGRKRGFGFVEFDDYDAVDKLMLKGNHHMVNGYKIDVKKAISKNDMNNMGPRGGGGGHRGGPMDNRGPPRGQGPPAPWGQSGDNYDNYGSRGGNQGYGGGGGYGGGSGGGYGNPDPWNGPGGGNGGGGNGYNGPVNTGWDNNSGGGQGGGGSGWNRGWSENSGWDNNDSYGGGSAGYGGYGSGGGYQSHRGGGQGQAGGPMRGGPNGGYGGGGRPAPYSVGAGQGGRGGGMGGGAGGYQSHRGGGQAGRW